MFQWLAFFKQNGVAETRIGKGSIALSHAYTTDICMEVQITLNGLHNSQQQHLSKTKKYCS